MPGWGRSDHPDPARFDYSMYGLSAFLETLSRRARHRPRKLVVHDWGCLALIGAQRRPELVEKLVVINAVPLLPGFRWHWVAQIWRRRGLGELANATTTKASMGLIMRQLSGDRRPMPPQFIDMIWRHLDHGTNEATLALYRHADPDRLALAGRDLNRIACPALVLWGANDPFLKPRFAEAYAAALPDAQLELVHGAGHWPWIDDARVIDRLGVVWHDSEVAVGSPTRRLPQARPLFRPLTGELQLAVPCLVPSPASEPSCPKAGATPAASSGSWSWSTSPTSWSAASPTASAPRRSPTASR